MTQDDDHDWPHDLPDQRRRAWLRGLVALLSLPLWRVSGLAPLAVAGRAAAAAPDFSAVTTKAAAQRLVRDGQLVEITLFPTELGGPEEPRNVSYITPEAAFVREMVIGTLSRFVREDVIDTLKVEPHYKGRSVVPGSIRMTATHSGQGGSFGTTIDVW